MTFAWPQTLYPLRDYLKKQGVEHDRFSTSRQAAFFAQQVIGSRIKFPSQGSDMMSTLFLIQKAIPVGSNGAARTADAKSPAAPARSAAKRSKRGVNTDRGQKINHRPDISCGIHIFCDGACHPNPGSGGWGLVVYQDGREIDVVSGGLADTTNNIMELTGMLEAVRWVINHFMKDKPVTIWCDSQYTVNGCNEWRHGWKRNGWNKRKPNSPKRGEGGIKNLDLWKDLDEALNKCSALTVSWVKGHVGIDGNERADELSEIGRKQAMEAAGIADPVEDYLDGEYRAIMAG